MCPNAINWQRLSVFLLAGCLWTLQAGCGSHVYKQRLAKTAKYYESLDRLKRSLSRPWRAQGIEIRVPKQFVLLPDFPENEVDPEADHEDSTDDMVDILPGLLGAWEAKVSVEGVKRPCYMYLMSNHDLLKYRSDESVDFYEEVVNEIIDSLDLPDWEKREIVIGLNLPDRKENRWSVESIPSGLGYVEKKEFRKIRLRPDEFVDDVRTDFTIYLFPKKSVRVALLFVVPRGIDSQEKMYERIALSLETLSVSSSEK
jgi:hypothetical protein